MDTQMIKKYAEQWIEENKQEFFDLADYIWEHPELGLEEFGAFRAITGLLARHGFAVESGMGQMPTAFVAQYGSEGPVFGINVEYDALPGLSQKKDELCPSPVTEGAPGHGCGHNILGAAAIMGGVAVRYAIEKCGLKATVKLLGSPFEESSVGKPLIGREGHYKKLDFILDWHPWNYNRADCDRCNSVFVLKFHFKGKTCHGATPWDGGRSALDAGMLFGHALEMLREHVKPNGPEAASTINYTFTDCGPTFANIVPANTTVQLYGRFPDLAVSEDAFKRIMLCAEGAAMATETTVQREIVTYTHNKLPNMVLSKIVHENMQRYGPPAYSEEEHNRVKMMQSCMGLALDGLDMAIKPFGESETIICDTSEFSWNAPYATFWLSMGPAGGWHNWMITACAGSSIGKKCLYRAAQIMSASAIDIVSDPQSIGCAKAELNERLNGREYRCLLPEGHTAPLGINKAIMDKYFPDRIKGV